jgi:hypothetical protein
MPPSNLSLAFSLYFSRSISLSLSLSLPFLGHIREEIPRPKSNKAVINAVHLQTLNLINKAPMFTRLHSFTFSPAVTKTPNYSAVFENEGTFQHCNFGACQTACSRVATFELERQSTIRHFRAF